MRKIFFVSLEKTRHWPDCRCVLCNKFSATCPVCGRDDIKTYPAFRNHEAAHRRRETKKNLQARPQNKQIINRRKVVIPDGLGYLTTALSTQHGLSKFNLVTVSRFSAALNAGRKLRKHFTKGHKLALARLAKDLSLSFLKVTCELPKDQAISTYKLALACDAHPGDVVSLLVSYGLEHLARELRTTGAAPTTTDPSKTAGPVVREIIQPRTPHEEFLDQNFPESAPPQKVIHVTEYLHPRQPTQVSRSIPRTTDEDEGEL